MPRARTNPKLKTRSSKPKQLVPLLLNWFAQNARDLPWRRTRDPYAIWVSEIMLQQTQIKTVVPYWGRWMKELPTIEALAKAPSEKIHKLWEGLGYYTRVRNLQKAAQQIVADGRRQGNESGPDGTTPHVLSHNFPEAFDAILALPGIGRYTAGAICSIAFNQPTSILDGNVIRVLTRLFGIATDPREKQTNAQLWQLAGELVAHAKDANACSFLNQSLMELGALICTPRQPKCRDCPVKKLCTALRENRVEQLPNLPKRAAATERRFVAFIIERDKKFLVQQRPAGVVNAHLWEFPNVEVPTRDGRARQSSTLRSEIVEPQRARSDAPYHTTNFQIPDAKPFCVIKHSITRYRITLEAHRVGAPASGSARRDGLATNPPGRRLALHGCWLTLAELKKISFPSAHKKILAALADAR